MAKTLKVRFYEITASVDEVQIDIGKMPWKRILRRWSRRSLERRRVDLENYEVLVEPRAIGERHLAIHRMRDADEFLSRVSRDGTVTEVMALDEDGNQFADTSCVVFKTGTNIFGIVQANQSAPRGNRVADWLTELDPLRNHAEFHAVPLRLDPRVDRLAEVDGATKVTFRVPVAELRPMGISLGEDAADLARDLPGAMATVTLSMGRRRPVAAEGHGLLGFIRERLLSVITQDDKAQARIYREVEADSKSKGKARRTVLEREMVDLIHHEIAHEFELSVEDGEVKIDATLQAIDNGLRVKASELRLASGNRGEGSGGGGEPAAGAPSS